MMDSSFDDTEKRFVLAEMIKASHMEIAMLVDFVKSYHVQPDWLQMQIPRGRNINQCIRAAEDMLDMHMRPPPMLPTLKRKSAGDINSSELQHLSKRLAMSPIESPHTGQLPLHAHPQSHAQPPPAMTFTAGTRNVNIQPRPPPLTPLNGYLHRHPILAPVPTSSPPILTIPGTRKRGRPSKAEKAEKEAQARAIATGYVPVAPMPAHHSPSVQQPISPAGTVTTPPDRSPGVVAVHASSYQIVSGPVDPIKPPTRKGRSPVLDKAKPRGLPETKIESSERTPSVNSLISAPREAAVRLHQPASIAVQTPAAVGGRNPPSLERIKDEQQNSHTKNTDNSNSQTPVSTTA